MLADDHTLLRVSLGSLLDQTEGLELVGSVPTGHDAVRAVRELRPDVLILDIDMPGQDAFQAARAVIEGSPETRVLFLSAFTSDHDVESALQAGARGYVVKSEPPGTLIEAIRTVARGRLWFSPAMEARIEFRDDGPHLRDRSVGLFECLTPRELETLRYLARGLTKREIADIMHVSVKTVEKHTTNVMAKLDVHDRVQLARLAISEGLARA